MWIYIYFKIKKKTLILEKDKAVSAQLFLLGHAHLEPSHLYAVKKPVGNMNRPSVGVRAVALAELAGDHQHLHEVREWASPRMIPAPNHPLSFLELHVEQRLAVLIKAFPNCRFMCKRNADCCFSN